MARGEIVEVGNLAGGSCRSARHLVSLLPRFLLDHGYTWVVFTATSVVRDILTSVGASLVELAPADAQPPGRRRGRLGPLLPERSAGHGGLPALRHPPVRRAGGTGAEHVSARSAAAGLGARPALRDGAHSISYGELPALVEAEGSWLAASGGRRFALLADNGCAWALTDLALANRALLHVPLPGYFTPGQMAHVLDDAGIDVGRHRSARRPSQALNLGFAPAGVSAQTGLALWRRPAPACLQSDSGGNGEDHLHLGQHRGTEGRVPVRRDCSSPSRDRWRTPRPACA